jgi:hypothetical protein
MALKFDSKWDLFVYSDFFQFPWLKFRVDAPSEGYEWLTRITYKFTRKINIYAQFREEEKARNLSDDIFNSNYQAIGQGLRRNYRMEIDFKTESNFTWTSSWQGSTYTIAGATSKGWALTQDLEYKQGKWRFFGRIALFETDDFDTRQYILERDVLWFFSLPPYYGEGQRRYIGFEYSPHKKVRIWAKWAQFYFPSLKYIGSAGERIEGNTRTDIRLQIRYTF